MNSHHTDVALAALKESLHNKVLQYQKAEEEGRERIELVLIYKELKALRQQIDLCQPLVKKAVGASASLQGL